MASKLEAKKDLKEEYMGEIKTEKRIAVIKIGKDKNTEYVKMCPKCNSAKVNLNQQGGLAFFGLPAFYTCKDCGYTNNFFPEIRFEKIVETK